MASVEYGSKADCSVAGCGTGVLALGFCPKHYYRFKKRGSTELPPPCTNLCETPGCFAKATRKGLCGTHYSRLRATGSTADPVPRRRVKCKADGCGKPAKGRGYCATHLDRVKRHGDPRIGKVEARILKAAESSCLLCGKAIRKMHAQHRFCSEWCRKRHAAGLPHKVECAGCGQAYVPINGQLYCSHECRKAKRRELHRELKAKERATQEGKRRHLEANRRYVEANKGKVLAYYRAKRREDPDFRMACWMRGVLRKVLVRANRKKTARCVELLGYSQQELRAHIERQFLKGMTWANHGEWHIDHIVPVAEYIKRGVTDPRVVNALPNLCPMWGKDNIRKGAKVQSLL